MEDVGRSVKRLFPFHILLDPALNIISLGASLPRAVPEVTVGMAFWELFSPIRPAELSAFDDLGEEDCSVFLVKARDGDLQLRGEVLRRPDGSLLFACCPWIVDRSLSVLNAVNRALSEASTIDGAAGRVIAAVCDTCHFLSPLHI